MLKDDIIRIGLEADDYANREWNTETLALYWKQHRDEHFAALVAATAAVDERNRNTKLLYQMHERAAAHHSYYKHAAIEINRKARNQS